jgi:hypothetical protein
MLFKGNCRSASRWGEELYFTIRVTLFIEYMAMFKPKTLTCAMFLRELFGTKYIRLTLSPSPDAIMGESENPAPFSRLKGET